MGVSDFYQRRGRVSVSYDLLDSHSEELARAFSGCLVIHVEHKPWARQDNFIVCSTDFDFLEEGCRYPEYQLVITHGDDGESIHQFIPRLRE